MNNILSFDEYKTKSLTLTEQEIIKDFYGINEDKSSEKGLFSGFRRRKATRTVENVLKDEIEQGKVLEKEIKETIKNMEDMCKNLKTKNEKGAEVTKAILKILRDIDKISFDTLSLLGDSNIDFDGFVGSVVLGNVVYFGNLLFPIRNSVIIKKSYDYFMGLIKQAIRKDLVMLQINFDQFQNVVLQTAESAENEATLNMKMKEIADKVIGETQGGLIEIFKKDPNNLKKVEDFFDKRTKREVERLRSSPNAQLFSQYGYDNTYKSTAENLKQFIQEDNQKQLDGIKSTMQKLAGKDVDMTAYVELLISSAEEYALKTTTNIHTNFLKMIDVFKLGNQKQLADMITDAENERAEEIKKIKEKNASKEWEKKNEEELKEKRKSGEEIYNKKKIKNLDDFYKLDLKEQDEYRAFMTYDKNKKLYDALDDIFKLELDNVKEGLIFKIEDLLILKDVFKGDVNKGKGNSISLDFTSIDSQNLYDRIYELLDKYKPVMTNGNIDDSGDLKNFLKIICKRYKIDNDCINILSSKLAKIYAEFVSIKKGKTKTSYKGVKISIKKSDLKTIMEFFEELQDLENRGFTLKPEETKKGGK